MKMDWWRACWRSKSTSGKETRQVRTRLQVGAITAKQEEGSHSGGKRKAGRARLLHGMPSARGVLPTLLRGGKKDKIARLEALSLASSLENDVMLLTEKMFAAFY